MGANMEDMASSPPTPSTHGPRLSSSSGQRSHSGPSNSSGQQSHSGPSCSPGKRSHSGPSCSPGKRSHNGPSCSFGQQSHSGPSCSNGQRSHRGPSNFSPRQRSHSSGSAPERPIRWGTIIPLIGGSALGCREATGTLPLFHLSYPPFGGNEIHIRQVRGRNSVGCTGTQIIQNLGIKIVSGGGGMRICEHKMVIIVILCYLFLFFQYPLNEHVSSFQ